MVASKKNVYECHKIKKSKFNHLSQLNTRYLEYEHMNQKHQIKSAQSQQNKILLELYYQTYQVQQNSRDSSKMSNNNLLSRLTDRF